MELEAADTVPGNQAAGLPGTGRPRAGSMEANGMITSGCSAAASATSSLGTGGWPLAASASTVNTTQAIRRSR